MASFKVGDAVQLLAGAIYLNNNKEVPETLLNTKLFVREVKADSCIIGRAKSGAVLGEVANANLLAIDGNIAKIETYIVQIPTANFPVYYSSNKNSGIVNRLKRFALVTIVDEKNGFGKIKVGSGWIELAKVNKLV